MIAALSSSDERERCAPQNLAIRSRSAVSWVSSWSSRAAAAAASESSASILPEIGASFPLRTCEMSSNRHASIKRRTDMCGHRGGRSGGREPPTCRVIVCTIEQEVGYHRAVLHVEYTESWSLESKGPETDDGGGSLNARATIRGRRRRVWIELRFK